MEMDFIRIERRSIREVDYFGRWKWNKNGDLKKKWRPSQATDK